MTKQIPTFNIPQYELRNFTNPYLTETQQQDVVQVENRVQSQLDFLAQMLGWNGPNYWGNLPSTADQKRQLLGGSFGVYNSYVIPRIYEVRNWNDTLVIDRLPFLQPGRPNIVVRVLLGDDVYRLQSVEIEGDKYVVSIGPLPQSFYDQIAENVQLRVDIPTFRPAPFSRPEVGISGDSSFVCGSQAGNLVLYPSYDTQKKFPVRSPILFAGSMYYFDQPLYLSTDSSFSPLVEPSYDIARGLWYFQVPESLSDPAGLTAYLVWANTDPSQASWFSLEVNIQAWVDPSDWGSISTLDNFRGVWGNKGGDLPYNFVFDALSIHGFDEFSSIYLPKIEKQLNFNDIVNFVYYQKTTISGLAPVAPNPGDLWWNDETGILSVWLPNDGCGSWVEIDYRQQPRQTPAPQVVYPDVSSFQANSGSLPVGTIVRIDDISGLSISDNVIGVQGTLASPGWLILHRQSSEPFWTPDEFGYFNVADFEVDALFLPYKVPVTIYDSTGLTPSTDNYRVSNLPIIISGDYEVLLMKYYTNENWEIFPDSILKYIAYSALFGGPLQGEMWWDYANSDPNTRAASLYYQNAWVSVNNHAQSGPPTPVLDLGTILFYCNGNLLTDGVAYVTDDFTFAYFTDTANGIYRFEYNPITLVGKAQLPSITISDSLTTTYRSDISNLVFSGITYYMSPNVYNSESPLRLWKSQALQVAETTEHLAEDNYINPLVADLNNGPAQENWERYFVRLPLEYERNGDTWQKVALICQDFGYWGSSIDPEVMDCPPEDDLPAIYEELFLYDQKVPDYTYVYCEPYLYSNIAYFNNVESGVYQNSGVFPASDVQFDEFDEAELVNYEPLHDRQADVVSPVNQGYGDWLGNYVDINPCVPLTGFFTTDLIEGGIEPVAPPVWDASIYKFAPTCENAKASYNVDANHYKIGYAYFVADASAAEDTFFDISKEASWRYPVTQPKTLYLTPR